MSLLRSWISLVWLVAMTLAGAASAQEFRILDASLDGNRRPSVRVEGASGQYFVLLRGPSVDAIRVPAGLAFGGITGGTVILTDETPESAPGAADRFYRVRRLPVTAPLDQDGDGIDDLYELGLGPTLNPLDPTDAQEDPDGDGISNLDEYLRGTDPRTPNAGAVTTVTTSPDQLETGVSVQREAIFRFSRALAPGSSAPAGSIFAEAGGRRLLTRPEISSDRRKLTLFFLEPMPGATRVRVQVNGDAFVDEAGAAVDFDGDGRAGGTGVLEFDTFGNQALDTTGVVGQVFASEVATDAAGGSINRPLEGVIVTVDGAEETLRAVTDRDGRFLLRPAPAGRFFVHIDGRQAVGSSWPNGDYYPVVGKAWEAVPGRTNNLAGETGVIYLPLILAGSLRAVSTTEETKVTFPAEVVAKNPGLAGVEVQVPPNALLADDGTRGGRVGIAPVAPDRIPSPLPPGLALPLVITIQTDGPQNFDRPVPVRFPNLPDPVTGRKLGPGEKSALWSFNHDTGRWEVVGPMTVTTDGNYVESDPGVGVRQPGWHGVQPGVGAGGGPLGGPDPCGGGGGGGSGGKNCHQNPNFQPDDPANYNGCGPDGWDYLVPDNPNGLLFPCASFFNACKAHDIGYNTCGKPKQETDDQFLQGMLAACECLDGLKKDECRGLAVLYHRAVTGGGADAYTDAQDKACICDDPPPPPPDCGGGSGSSPSLLATPGARDLSRRLALHATSPANAGSAAAVVPQLGPHRFAVVDVRTGTVVQRGHAGSAGVAFAELILAPHTTYDLAILQEKTLHEGKVRITTGESGSRIEIPPILIKPPVSWDFDGDGLHDGGELVLGTDPRLADSDGDGVGDGAEVKQGTNPLDGQPLATGVIGAAATTGNAIDVFVWNDFVLTANDDAGISLFRVDDTFTPSRLASVDTPGRAMAVACGGDFAGVADGASGLAIIDLSVPSEAKLARQVPLGAFARAIAVSADLAYVGLDNGYVAVVDLRRGTVQQRLNLGGGPVQDLWLDGDTLYALVVGRLYLVPLDAGELGTPVSVESPGSLGAGGRRLRVFAAGGRAYATHTAGFNVFDVSAPTTPRLIQRNDTAQRGWIQMAPNGSGLGLATVGPNSTDDGPHDVSLYDLGADGTGARFLATFVTPGLATAVALRNGLAYVADGKSGLQVVHYLAFDRAGRPPEITLAASFPLSPARAEEGKLVRVTAQVRDDVQVRNVEFYVDGRLVGTDGSFGFETRFVTPLRSGGQESFVLRARAFDTGGNATWTDPIAVALVADATPPRVVRRFPEPGAIVGEARAVSATFNEPVRPGTLSSATFVLRGAGPDGRFGTVDDLKLAGATVTWNGERNTAEVAGSGALGPGLWEARLRPPIADLAGNPMPADVTWTFWVSGQDDIDADGIPDALEAALGTDPRNPDSNGNGILDGQEDFDFDGLRSGWEIVNGLDPRKQDSDGNGVKDGDEDLDDDGVSNRKEHDANLNALSPDTDGDGWDDGGELASGSDPGNAESRPVLVVSSLPVSVLNAVPETPARGAGLQVVSPAVGYLNAAPAALPAGTRVELSSASVSYLSARPEVPPAGALLQAVSATVSYLNAAPSVVQGTVFVPSPVVSYRNQ